MANIRELESIALRNRRRIVDMVYVAGVGHVGGSLSVIDMLTAIYELEVDLDAERRARVVLSKGHVTPALYAELTEKGIVDERDYSTFRQIDSKLQGHPYTVDIPQIDATTGLLGQGFSMAVGMALAKRVAGDDHQVYAIAGDGEMQEGQMWEALMCASHYRLDNITFVIDYNKLSSGGPVNESLRIEPLARRLKAFGCKVQSIDGHDMAQIAHALGVAKRTRDGRPAAIISNTIKGKGVSYMENDPAWHSKGISDKEHEIALTGLGNSKERDVVL